MAIIAMGAQPAVADERALPVVECDVVESAGFWTARYRLSNPARKPIGYRFAARIDGEGTVWRSEQDTEGLQPGAERVREFRPFQQGHEIETCTAAIEPDPAAAPPLEPGYALDTEWESEGTRHFHGDRAVGGFLLGSIGAVGFGVLGGLLGMKIECGITGCPGWLDGIAGLVFGGAAGGVFGTTAGVSLLWGHEGSSSPIWPALGGALAGGFAGIGLANLLAPRVPESAKDVVGFGSVIAGPVLGASIWVALTHRHRDDAPAIGSLLELRDGQLEVGIPVPVRAVTGDGTVTAVPLAAGRF